VRRDRVRLWLIWFGVLVLVGAGLLTQRHRLDKAHVTLAFLLVVLLGSSADGRALGISLAGAAFLVFNWFFLPPYYTLVIADPLDWLVLLAFLITGVTAAQLLERSRNQAALAERRADEIDRIATLGAENLNAPKAEDALDAIAAVIRAAMLTDSCDIYLRGDGTGLRLAGSSPKRAAGDKDSGLLSHTVERAEPTAEREDGTLTLIPDALRSTTTAPTSPPALARLRALGIPLQVRGRVVGALRLASSTPFSLSEDQRRVLGALAYYAALGAERIRLTDAAEQTEALRRADRLKDSLLASVSHDLRTPLTAIKGIANEVWRGGDPHRAHIIEQEADRLTALVEDLLEMSQLNAGTLRLNVALNTADDVIGAVLDRVESVHGQDRVETDIVSEGEILVGTFDFAHTVRALTNLLENAIKYSPPGARVTLHARRDAGRLLFVVEDEGHGVTPSDAERIFEPFYRGRAIPDGVRGTGLGLSIARQLAEAQHGALTYQPREDGGSRFVLSVPLGTLPSVR
jgi:two-component system, OmpR family, sensor histidine kinase KdpD